MFVCWLLYFVGIDFLLRISMEEVKKKEQGRDGEKRREELEGKEEGEAGKGSADGWGYGD